MLLQAQAAGGTSHDALGSLLYPPDSDSFSAPLNVHILTVTSLLHGVVELLHPAGFLGGGAAEVLSVAIRNNIRKGDHRDLSKSSEIICNL